MTLAFPQDMTAKTTPVDADILLIADSADSNAAKKVTMTQLKTNIINDSSTATDETWSADKLGTQFTGKANTVHTHAASDIISGTLVHERGGLEADVSAYNGLVKITGGATSAVTAPSGAVVGTTDSQTLTNKTISPADNTINGDILDVDYVPTNYTRNTTGTESTAVDQLAANLKGIDTAIGIINTYKNGTTTKNLADASATQNIAHGLSSTPKQVRLKFMNFPSNNTFYYNNTEVVYNGTTSSVIGSRYNGTGSDSSVSGSNFVVGSASTDYQTGVITFDATNIIITWTKQNNPTGTVNILWEATT